MGNDIEREEINDLKRRLGRLESALGKLFSVADIIPGRRARFSYDAEVRKFIEESMWELSLDDMAAEALAKFGEHRAPSRAAIGRHRTRFRDGLKRLLS